MDAFTLELEPDLGLAPPIIQFLNSVPTNLLSHVYYGRRHPLGIFNIKFTRAMSDLLNCVKIITEDPMNVDKALSNYETLLFSTVGFLDSCYEIILTLCPQKPIPTPKEFLH